MKNLSLSLIIFLCMPCLLLNAEEVSLSLDEAIAIALRSNRDILLKQEDVKKAKQKLKEAEASLLPTLNFTGSFARTQEYYPKNINQTTTQTTLKQYLYKGGEIINTIQLNKNKIDVTEALLDKTKLELVLDVKKAFYTLLLANELNNLNKAILENSKRHIDFIEERFKNGQASESDILQVKTSLANVEEAYEISLNQLENTRILLTKLLFLDDEIKITPIAKFIYEKREIAIEEALLGAIKNRPEIRQYEAQEKADKESIEIAKADTRPNIYVSWDYYSRSITSLTFSPTKAWNDYNIIGVTFSWPIFDGFATKHKVEQAIIDLKETKALKDKVIREIATEVKNAYLSLKDAIFKIKRSDSDLVFYKDNLLTLEQKYREGLVSQLDLEDANLKYAVADFNKKEAIYDYIIAKSNFDKARGGF